MDKSTTKIWIYKVVAAVLGNPLGYKGLLTSSDDANNLSDGIYNVINADSPSNMHAYNSILFQFTNKFRIDCYQILFEANEKNIKARMKAAEGWTSWKVLFAF